jgi:hypothetical protein
MQNSYDILGIPHTSSRSDIKKAYHKLSLIHHPDRPTGDIDKFLKIKEAYEELTMFNPNKTHNIYTQPNDNAFVFVNHKRYVKETGQIYIDVSFSRNILKANTVSYKSQNHTWYLIGQNGGTMVLSPEFVKANGFVFEIHFLTNSGKSIDVLIIVEDERTIKEKLLDKYVNPAFIIKTVVKIVLFIIIYCVIYNLIF